MNQLTHILNWFHIKTDLHTQDAKIQAFSGSSHQEIDLQLRVELTKTENKLKILQNEYNQLKYNFDNIYNNTQSITNINEKLGIMENRFQKLQSDYNTKIKDIVRSYENRMRNLQRVNEMLTHQVSYLQSRHGKLDIHLDKSIHN